MLLQNRVSPFGDLFADPARGLFMGNREGAFSRSRTLTRRRTRPNRVAPIGPRVLISETWYYASRGRDIVWRYDYSSA